MPNADLKAALNPTESLALQLHFATEVSTSAHCRQPCAVVNTSVTLHSLHI